MAETSRKQETGGSTFKFLHLRCSCWKRKRQEGCLIAALIARLKQTVWDGLGGPCFCMKFGPIGPIFSYRIPVAYPWWCRFSRAVQRKIEDFTQNFGIHQHKQQKHANTVNFLSKCGLWDFNSYQSISIKKNWWSQVSTPKMDMGHGSELKTGNHTGIRLFVPTPTQAIYAWISPDSSTD